MRARDKALEMGINVLLGASHGDAGAQRRAARTIVALGRDGADMA